jgi:hypothetical protein
LLDRAPAVGGEAGGVIEFRLAPPSIPARHSFGPRDVEQGANDAILALDGKLGREDAKLIAAAVLEGFGLTRRWR